MEKEIERLNRNIENANSSFQKLENRFKLSELENETIKNKLSSTVSVHREEMSLCNERIRQLEMRIGQLMSMMEEDHS